MTRALERQTQLQSALTGTDFVADVLESAGYPTMLLLGQPVKNASIYVYVGPFASTAAVTDFCADHTDLSTTCADAQPQPAG